MRQKISVSGQEYIIDLNILTVEENKDETEHLLHSLITPSIRKGAEKPNHFILLLDRSGSMNRTLDEEPIDNYDKTIEMSKWYKVQESACDFIDGLYEKDSPNQKDSFSIICFDDTIHTIKNEQRQSIFSAENAEEAQRLIRAVKKGKETRIDLALQELSFTKLEQLSKERNIKVLLLSDGQNSAPKKVWLEESISFLKASWNNAREVPLPFFVLPVGVKADIPGMKALASASGITYFYFAGANSPSYSKMMDINTAFSQLCQSLKKNLTPFLNARFELFDPKDPRPVASVQLPIGRVEQGKLSAAPLLPIKLKKALEHLRSRFVLTVDGVESHFDFQPKANAQRDSLEWNEAMNVYAMDEYESLLMRAAAERKRSFTPEVEALIQKMGLIPIKSAKLIEAQTTLENIQTGSVQLSSLIAVSAANSQARSNYGSYLALDNDRLNSLSLKNLGMTAITRRGLDFWQQQKALYSMPFVSGDGSTREIITIEDARFDLAKQILKQLDLDLKQLSKEERAKPEIIFQQLCRLVAQQFKESSDERINSLSERVGRKTDTGHYLVPLEVFALAQVGNCRHMSLLTAVLLGLLAQTGQLDAGSIRVCTSMDLNGRSHMWVRYHNKANGDYFLIDPTNATEQQVVLLNSLENRKQLVHYYAKERKLLQLLTRQLFNIASETKQMDFLKGLDFNIELRVLAQFIKTGQHLTLDPKLLKPYLCPLSGKLPSYPVRCPELGYLKVYDKEALEAELKSKAIAGQYKTVEFELAINPLLELFYLIQKHNKLIKVEKFIKEEEPEQPKEESFALAEDTEDCILLQDLLKTDKTCEAGKEGKAQAGSWGAFMNFFGSGVTEKEDPEHKPGPQLGN